MNYFITLTRIAIFLGATATYFCIWPAIAADSTNIKTTLCEDFENKPQITFWSNNGLWKVNSAGPTTDKAAAGKQSYKIDVTWLDTSFDCWRPLPLKILYSGNPTVKAKLLVTHGKAQLGHPYSTAETGRDGMIVAARVSKLHPGTPSPWLQCQARAEGRAVQDELLSAEVVWARPDADGRTVVYIDDIEIEGDFPASIKAELSKRTKSLSRLQNIILTKKAQALDARFRTLKKKAETTETSLSSEANELLRQYAQRLNEHCKHARAKTSGKVSRLLKSPCVSDLRDARTELMLLEDAETARIGLVDYAKQHPNAAFVPWIVKAIANRHQKVLPKRFPVPGVVGTRLKLSACAGEYEPASFAIHAPRGLDGLTVTASDAVCGDKKIPATRIDIRLVKCWWQAGLPIADLNHPQLTPEMLLYDADFVAVDGEKHSNTVRNPDAPRDADKLLPLNIPADSVQQYWITVHVPDDAAAGDYSGTIHLQATVPGHTQKTSMDLPITIGVRPFRLQKPIIQYSIFYLPRLHDSDKPGIHKNGQRSQKQYLADMRNIKAHGISHPICYQTAGPLLDRAIELRKQAGLSVDPFYWMGYHDSQALTSQKPLDSLKKEVSAAVEQVGKHGIKQLFIYGLDEAVGERLASQRKAFEAIHEAGASTFASCYCGTFELVGDLLDVALFSGPPCPAETEKWHSKGSKIFSYGNPQSGVELPEVYRRNYGLALWQAGCDGAMDWAFTHSVGNVWDDCDHFKYRDIVFTYPTVDGPIDTIQWEGNREGIDDVRYLSTLLQRIEAAKSTSKTAKLAAEAKAWLDALDPGGDLDDIREQMAAWIIRLDDSKTTPILQSDTKD